VGEFLDRLNPHKHVLEQSRRSFQQTGDLVGSPRNRAGVRRVAAAASGVAGLLRRLLVARVLSVALVILVLLKRSVAER
jgi:hypothetical protein